MHRNLYTQRLLHTEFFTQSGKLLHREPFNRAAPTRFQPASSPDPFPSVLLHPHQALLHGTHFHLFRCATAHVRASTLAHGHRAFSPPISSLSLSHAPSSHVLPLHPHRPQPSFDRIYRPTFKLPIQI